MAVSIETRTTIVDARARRISQEAVSNTHARRLLAPRAPRGCRTVPSYYADRASRDSDRHEAKFRAWVRVAYDRSSRPTREGP
jgi:hypothetical protein